jgi:hypothetical protein
VEERELCGVSPGCIYTPCTHCFRVSREKQRECRCCVAAVAFGAPAGVGRPASLLSCSKCILSCIIINNSQDTGVRCRGVRRRNFLVYCLCYYDRSAILGSNMHHQLNFVHQYSISEGSFSR